jgi:hypothetical protein
MVRTQRRLNRRSKPIRIRKQTKSSKKPSKKILTRKVKKQRGG